MSTNGDCGCSKKKMTRGEFLGTGAAVAAVGAVSPIVSSSPRVQPCGPTCDPRGPERWAVPAGVLNALWSDIIPRLMAREWKTPMTTYFGYGAQVADQGIVDHARLAAEVPTLIGTNNSGPPIIDVGTTCVFDDRVTMVAEYLNNPRIPKIPMFIHPPGGGFDFILSDHGIEFFVPDFPSPPFSTPEDEEKARQELVRFFTYRNTGRRALGLPAYLVERTKGLATDAPTGPSQVNADLDLVVHMLELAELDACVDGVLHCFELHEPAELRERGNREPRVRPPRRLTLSAYEGIMAATRCWYLSGAVFRGIMVELPRVVALCWHERLMNVCSITDTGSAGINESSYDYRFGRPGDNGLRSIFAERLETWLPDSQHMAFRDFNPDIFPLGAVWRRDVTVTNRGLHIPQVPEPPTLSAMLDAIERGRAGNPVFTDSSQSA